MPDHTPSSAGRRVRSLLIDLDGSLPGQPAMRRRLATGSMRLVDARDLASRLRIVAGRRALSSLRDRIAREFPLADGPPPLIFYGSGDFHHLAALFIEALSGPLLVLHIDNHPDWTSWPASWNCGGWVNRALEFPSVHHVVTVGPASDDFVRPQLSFANLQAIRDGRLEVHPWRAEPSRLWGRPVEGPGCSTRDGRIVWQGLEGWPWEGVVEAFDRRLPALPFWVSFDKDALAPAEAVTNWDQGGLTLDAVLALVRRLAGRRRLLGMDVCGDYSRPVFSDPFRALLSATDRPRVPTPDPGTAQAVNDDTNMRIMQAADGMAATGLWGS
ncbi:arginase family protein [Azospirillum sp. B510]|uniref:arginase family protein n=1 Tax=Azospirillum sp. (strain B510) TaxID=137722 RepID=UPI000310C231|nr:arginase family protein [Azospirillum sp. B510]